MKKFKHNYLTTLWLAWGCATLFLPPLCWTIIGIVGIRETIPVTETLWPPLVIVCLGFIFEFLLCQLINLIIWIFLKPHILLDRESVSYKGETIRYDEVEHIRFEMGVVRKYSKSTPCSLSLMKNGEAVVHIPSPSLVATCLILKRCPQATKRLFPKALAIGYAVAYPLSFALYAITAILL